MSLKKVKQVRADRGFKIWDLIVYAVLIALIVALFIAFVFTRDSSPITSISVLSGFGDEQRTVCTYNFVTDTLTVLDSSVITRNSRTDEGIELVFHGQNEGEYNTVYINKTECSVSVTSANCPALDCVHTAAITNNSSLPIICATHAMIIRSDEISGSVIQ